jgi:hypothetical protein
MQSRARSGFGWFQFVCFVVPLPTVMIAPKFQPVCLLVNPIDLTQLGDIFPLELSIRMVAKL